MSMTTNKLAGKVALITGASSGIGKATALMFAESGIKVALVARREEKLKALKKELEHTGGAADYYVADVSREDEAKASVAWAVETFGAVDILVNNAGIVRPGTVERQDSQEWRDTFDLNVLAPMYMCQAVLPGMKKRQSGHIVNISSNAAKIPGGASQSSYAASKYAITALSSSLRRETGADGIRVTIIEPGTTETGVAESIPDEKLRQAMEQHMHKATNMQPEDMAAAILYAVSQPERVNVSEIWLTPTKVAETPSPTAGPAQGSN